MAIEARPKEPLILDSKQRRAVAVVVIGEQIGDPLRDDEVIVSRLGEGELSDKFAGALALLISWEREGQQAALTLFTLWTE